MNLKRRSIATLLLISFLCSMLISVTVGATSPNTADNTTKIQPEKNENTILKSSTVKWPKGPSVEAEGAVVIEASTGMILYSKNMNEKLYPASITKIMTSLLAVENSSLSEVVTFSKEAMFSIEPGSSHAGGTVGEQMTMEQSLNCIMLASANEVSNAVGEHIGGSLENFAKMMTERAKEIGCKNTHFANANGLHDDNHYTTPYDMALIMRTAMQNKTFRTIAGTKRIVIPPTNKQVETRYYTNHHQMLVGNKYPKYKYDYTIAGKTGYTEKAGNTLVTVANKDGLELICVVMKSKSATAPKNIYTDTISLFDFVYENYTKYNISEENSAPTIDEDNLFTKYNSLFNSEQSPLYIDGDNSVVIPNTSKLEDVKQTIEYFDNVDLSSGQATVGKITYTLGDKVVGNALIKYQKQNTPVLITDTSVVKKNNSSNSIANLLGLGGNNGKVSPLILFGIIVIIIILLFFVLYFLKKKRFLGKSQYTQNRKTKTFTNLHDKFMKYH